MIFGSHPYHITPVFNIDYFFFYNFKAYLCIIDFINHSSAPLDSGFLPAGPVHYTDPVDFHGKDYINTPFSLSAFGSPPNRYLKIKGREMGSLNVSLPSLSIYSKGHQSRVNNLIIAFSKKTSNNVVMSF